MFSSSSLCNDKDAMLRWISDVSSSSLCNDKDAMLGWISQCFQVLLCNDKDAMLRWISEDVFKFFFMQWQGCNVKMNKSGCFQVLLYAMTRMQC